jgi:hypothetical protein
MRSAGCSLWEDRVQRRSRWKGAQRWETTAARHVVSLQDGEDVGIGRGDNFMWENVV